MTMCGALPTEAMEPFSEDVDSQEHESPAERCVELKSLKLYLWSYRDRGAFHEAVTNQILDDLVAAVAPLRMTVEGDFYVRGGIRTVVEAQHP